MSDIPRHPEDWLPWRDITDPFDAGGPAPLFPPIPRLVTPREPSGPERRLYVALLPCGCQWAWTATSESQLAARLSAILRAQGGTVRQYPEGEEPEPVHCPEHAEVGR